MRLSLNGLKRGLTDPRKMMLIAGVLAAMGLVAGYIEVHAQADRAMALRKGPPPAQTLQAVVEAQNPAFAGEVTILAEADLSRAVIVTLRTSVPHRSAHVVPLFGLSVAGAAQAGLPDLGASRPALMGYILRPVDAGGQTPRAEALAVEVFGSAGARTVMKLNGTFAQPGGFDLLAEGAITGMGLSFDAPLIAIEPFVGGRAAALAAQAPAQAHRALFLLAGLVMVVSVAVSLRDDRDEAGMAMWALPERSRAPETAQETANPAPQRPQFAPIPSQQALHARATARRSGRFSALAGAAGRAVKNLPRRPEDEAL
ncbi:MAG: hypothetical protein AAF771_17235 [Pseudomonadota bacterium]